MHDISEFLSKARHVVITRLVGMASASYKVAQAHAAFVTEERARGGFAWLAWLGDAFIDVNAAQKDALLNAGASLKGRREKPGHTKGSETCHGCPEGVTSACEDCGNGRQHADDADVGGFMKPGEAGPLTKGDGMPWCDNPVCPSHDIGA